MTATIQGQPLLRPNDLAIDQQGGIYFSAQPRRPGQPPVPGRERGILYRSAGGAVTQVSRGIIEQPNGVVLSPDERRLYAADSRGESIIAFDVEAPGSLKNPNPFGKLEGAPIDTPDGIARSADGMTVDSQGRVYVATRLGVEVLSPAGQHLGTIRIVGGTGPQNVAFAGRNKKTLFVVGARALWRIQMDAQGFIGRAK